MNQNKEIKGSHRILYSKKTASYLFYLPFIVSFLIFFLYLTTSTVFMNFQKVEGFNNVKRAGLNNYKHLLNIHSYNMLKSSTIYMVYMVSIMLIPLITIATSLSSKMLKFKNFLRSVISVSTLIPVIVTSIAFRLMFGETEAGLFNSIILKLGGEIVTWETGYVTGMTMMITLVAWRELGINMVYYLSAFQNIPEELCEATDIDRTNAVQKSVFVAIPQVKPIIIYILTLAILSGYRMLTEGYAYWDETNPGNTGLTTVRYIHQQAFQRNNFGMNSATGVVLLTVVFAVNMSQLNFFGPFRKEDI